MAWTRKSSAAPFALQRGEGGIESRRRFRHRRAAELGADGCGERLQALGLRIALIGEGDFRALRGQRARDSPGDGMVVRHAHHQSAFALHHAWRQP